jgi:hypothetical protein
MTFTFNGKRYRFRLMKSRYVEGACSPPDGRGKEIAIRGSLRSEHRLDALIHEMLHASCWDLAEETVERTATDMARALWRLGYRGEK